MSTPHPCTSPNNIRMQSPVDLSGGVWRGFANAGITRVLQGMRRMLCERYTNPAEQFLFLNYDSDNDMANLNSKRQRDTRSWG